MRKSILACLVVIYITQWLPNVSAASPLQVAGVVFDDPISVSGLTIQQQITPNDPLFPQQSYLNQIDVGSAWSATTGSATPIAIIDTGVDLRHDDLIGKLWINADEIPDNGIDDDHNGYIDDYHGFNFTSRNSDISDVHGHGTGVASIIAAQTNNSRGMAGINWAAPLMVLKALNYLGGGDFTTVAEALRYAADNGARIINMSFGSLDNVSTLNDAVNYALGKNVIIVAAVGNNNGLGVYYPAAYPNVIAVSSVDDSGRLSVFSNYGPGVDVAAPGENILMAGSFANNISSFVRGSGSSFAAAEVTGVVSLLVARNPQLTAAQADAIIRATANPLPGDVSGQYFGAGRINAGAAVNYYSRTLNGQIAITNPQPIADGANTAAISVTVKDEFDQPRSRLPINAQITGTANIINGRLALAGQLVDLGVTDQLGRVSFDLSSTTAETKTITFASGADSINIGAPPSVIFRPVSRAQYKMTWLQQSPSVTMLAGETAALWVEVRNTGNIAWVSDPSTTQLKGQLRLGTSRPNDRQSNFYDFNSWLSLNRSAHMTPSIVRPGEVARFEFTVRAARSGNFKEYFRPVAEYITWLNDLGIYWAITVI